MVRGTVRAGRQDLLRDGDRLIVAAQIIEVPAVVSAVKGVERIELERAARQRHRFLEAVVAGEVIGGDAVGVGVERVDLEDLGGVNPFALEPRNISQYNFNYLGKEKIDELNLHVFEVAPKVMPNPKSGIRLFTGRIWVDDEDLMIVKSKGKAVPETKDNKFPIVETWRENVDGKYRLNT